MSECKHEWTFEDLNWMSPTYKKRVCDKCGCVVERSVRDED